MVEIENQEMKDYLSAKGIINGLFGEKLVGTDKLDQYSPVDMTFTATTRSNSSYEYGMEIKSTPKRTYITDGFILKVSKYIKIMNWAKENSHKPYIIYLCEDLRHYYIFDLDKLKLDMSRLQVLPLKLKQYDQSSPMVQTAVIKLRTDDAIKYGSYVPGDNIDFNEICKIRK